MVSHLPRATTFRQPNPEEVRTSEPPKFTNPFATVTELQLQRRKEKHTSNPSTPANTAAAAEHAADAQQEPDLVLMDKNATYESAVPHLKGLGAVGKTSTTLEYARRASDAMSTPSSKSLYPAPPAYYTTPYYNPSSYHYSSPPSHHKRHATYEPYSSYYNYDSSRSAFSGYMSSVGPPQYDYVSPPSRLHVSRTPYGTSYDGTYGTSVQTRRDLPMIIGSDTVSARHDTMAEGNVMSRSLARQLKLDIQPISQASGTFQLANGKLVRSIGYVETWCKFALDQGVSVKCKFWIWDKVAGAGMVMGRAFLKATKTLSSFRYRLRKAISSSSLPLLSEISSGTSTFAERLLCSIDGQQTYISPDTGSDLDIMSLRYVLKQGYNVDTRIRRNVQLGDGTVVTTVGQVANIRVTLGAQSLYKTFDVLTNLSSDIILGESTLEDLAAYTDFESYFEEIDLGHRHYDMSTIVDLGRIGNALAEWREKRQSSKKVTKASNIPQLIAPNQAFPSTAEQIKLMQQLDDIVSKEMFRRDSAERFLNSLDSEDVTARARMIQIEDQHRNDFEIKRQKVLEDIAAGSVPTRSTTTSSQSTATTTA